jgi:hypothetical protein
MSEALTPRAIDVTVVECEVCPKLLKSRARIEELTEHLHGILKSHCECPDCRAARRAVQGAPTDWPHTWTPAQAMLALHTPCPHSAIDRPKRLCARCVEIALQIAYAAGLASRQPETRTA